MKRYLLAFLLCSLLSPSLADAGWAIQRADGTYRGWNSWTQDDALQAGETWVQLPTMPTITRPPVADFQGFLKWLPMAFDFPTINALAKDYPEFNGYVSNGNVSGMQWCVLDAKTKGTINASQYVLFQGANTTYNLGMVLP